jgi:hypothetical protein
MSIYARNSHYRLAMKFLRVKFSCLSRAVIAAVALTLAVGVEEAQKELATLSYTGGAKD